MLKESPIILLAQLESLSKSIPEIIKRASQSQLGILVLLIIVLFGLAFYFFRGAAVGWGSHFSYFLLRRRRVRLGNQSGRRSAGLSALHRASTR